MSAQSFAAPAEFNGYMRSGVMHGKSAFGTRSQATKVGRLANQNDTFGEMQISADIAKVDDTVWTVSTMFALSGDGKENNWDSNISNRQFYAEVKGLLDFDKDAKLWVGKKYVHREDVHITDFYYYNISGHGVGIDDLTLGSGKLNLAWTRHDGGYNAKLQNGYTDETVYEFDSETGKAKPSKNSKNQPTKSRINNFDARYSFPVWDGATLQLGATYLNAERDKNGSNDLFTWADGKEVKDGLNLSAELTLNVLGGFNKTVLQSFSGASAKDASLDGTSSELYADEGQGWRFMNFGNVYFTEDFGMFHQFVYAYNSGTKSRDHFRGVSAVVRPYYRLTKMTKIVAEVGAFDEKEYGTLEVGKAQSKVSKHGAKYTLAYAISPNAGDFWQRPEIRFYVSHISTSSNLSLNQTEFGAAPELKKGEGRMTSDNIFGVQVEAWW